MRNLKKFLALVLAMMMTLSLMVTVNAANVEFEDGETITDAFLEDITVLAGMGVFEGYGDGTFKPTDTVTRAEMAAIVYRLVTGDAEGTSDALHGQYGSFKDVADDKWYAGYVGYCANAGLILGYGDGTFRPSNKVTGYEALVMVLRAMGYDQPTEFSKSDWRTHAASIATQRSLLSKINATRYKGTLSQPALREVVGEIVFQAANQPMVEWTAAFGYQTTHYSANAGASAGEQRVLNDTLGYLWYGLDSTTRIVLGNKMTGEIGTVLGAEKDGTIAYTNSGKVATSVPYTMYDYPGTQLVKIADIDKAGGNGKGNASSDPSAPGTTDDIVVLPASYGLTLAGETDLEYFGHKVTAWYNAKDPSAAKQTYAIFDKASLAEYVTVNPNGTAGDKTTGVLSCLDSVDLTNDANLPTLGYAAIEAGFSVDIGGDDTKGGTGNDGSDAYWSNEYSRINVPTAVGVLPGRERNLSDGTGAKATESPIAMYYLVSNNTGKSVDVVVSLNANVGRITEKNTTASTKTLTLGVNPTHTSGMHPHIVNTDGTSNRIGNANTPDGTINLKKLTEGSVQTLGTTVTAWEIMGTTKLVTANTSEIVGQTTEALARSDYFYDLKAPIASTTGTVRTFRYQDNTPAALPVPTCTITLVDGTVLKQSGMWDSVYANSGINQDWASGLEIGREYTFYLDKAGRVVGWSLPSVHEFLYTTFGDYQVGELGTGTLDYAVTGVNWDGEIVKNHAMTQMRLIIDDDNNSTFFRNNVGDPIGTDSTPTDYPSATETLADGYNKLPITKKDQGNANAGNRIKEGRNTAFMIDGDGDMTYVIPANQGIQFIGYDADGTLGDDISGADIDVKSWTITSDDVSRGFVRVYNGTPAPKTGGNIVATQTAYLLTNDTKFIVVTGSGTSDLKVETYDGIDELVGNGTEAVIDVTDANGGAFGDDGDEVWFKTVVDQFGTVLTGNNATIDTVILSDTNLSRYSTQTLYYNFDQTTDTGAILPTADQTNVKQYELWHDGVLDTYFIDWSVSTKQAHTPAAPALWGSKNGIEPDTFYTLTPIDEVNGVTVYKANAKNTDGTANLSYADPNKCQTDVGYKYIVVNNLSTAELTKGTGTLPFSVANAKVCDVQYKVAQANGLAAVSALGRNEVTTIEELHNAVSVKNPAGDDYVYDTITVAVVYENAEVVTLYICDISHS